MKTKEEINQYIRGTEINGRLTASKYQATGCQRIERR